MSENLPYLREAMIPLDEVQRLMEGSFEQMAALLDGAVEKSRTLFVAEGSDEDVARVATFPGRVIVGTSGGHYFEAVFVEKDGDIVIESAEPYEVRVVDQGNAAEYVREYTMSTVDALLSEDASVAKERLLALASLQEEHTEQAEVDYSDEVVEHLSAARPWRHVYSDQNKDIRRQVVDQLEAIGKAQLEAKYKPLYETDDIPEENFEDYRELVNTDLRAISSRFEKVQHAVEAAYIPFAESINVDDLTEEEDEVIGHFKFFAEDLIEDLQELRQLVAEAAQNEHCVMCLGHIYDSLTESLADYEIAGAFVERMVQAFDEAS